MKKAFVIGIFLLVAGVLLINQQQKSHQNPVLSQAVKHSTASSLGMMISTGRAIVRINQLDPTQYNSQADYATWSYSTCSVAAMAEVMDRYGMHLRIADVLAVEAGLHEITPDLGMLNGVESIQRTVAHFGFQARSMNASSLDTLIQTANAGTPVIVGFPPNRWEGGHVLVVHGGNSQFVYLTDSSRLNMQSMGRSTFLKYWVGFAVVVTPMTGGQQ